MEDTVTQQFGKSQLRDGCFFRPQSTSSQNKINLEKLSKSNPIRRVNMKKLLTLKTPEGIQHKLHTNLGKRTIEQRTLMSYGNPRGNVYFNSL